jgi:hypothetical protein
MNIAVSHDQEEQSYRLSLKIINHQLKECRMTVHFFPAYFTNVFKMSDLSLQKLKHTFCEEYRKRLKYVTGSL